MKIQIIQLDQNDDFISIQDKMNWSQTRRILLVWPIHGQLLHRQLDLSLLKRHATKLGSELALVTVDDEVRFYAQQEDIPVYDSLPAAQYANWRTGLPKKIDLHREAQRPDLIALQKNVHPQTSPRSEHPTLKTICLGFSILALVALGVFLLPGAQVILSPHIEIQSSTFYLSADPSSTSINLSTSNLPEYVQNVIVEGHDTITATGSSIIPDQSATGRLEFTNWSDHQVSIPQGTMVATLGNDPVRFITTSPQEVMVDPDGSVVLDAQAAKPGSSGNIPPNQLVVIEADLDPDLIVTNPDPMLGGTDASIASPSTNDLQILRDRLSSSLRQAALTQLQSILPAGDTVISPTLTLVETIDESASPAVGEPGETLQLTLRVQFQSQVVSYLALHSLIMPILDSNIPAGYSAVPDTLKIKQLSDPTLGGDGKSHWKVEATRQLQYIIAINQAAEIVKGMTVAKALDRLTSTVPQVEKVQIKLAPTWWPVLPFVAMRIHAVQSEIP